MTLYIVTRPEMNSGDAKPPLAINGIAIPYEFDTPIELPEEALALLRAADGLTVTEAPADEPEAEPVSQSPATGEDDGTASPDGGVADGGADNTEGGEHECAHPLLQGSIKVILPRLAGLTKAELTEAREAEAACKRPRVSLIRAIDDLIANTKE